jgi:hypothetical protein
MKQQKNGYILIVTLLMIAGMTAIGTYIYLRSTVFVPFMRTMYNREKAKEIAFGGLQLAIQQLSQFDESGSDQKTKQETGGAQQLFARIAPIINRWQTFALKKNSDGIDGNIQICLVCEEGKININRIYNFEKSEFFRQGQLKGDWQKIMSLICKRIEDILGGKELFSSLESFLKNRKYPLYDVTELLTIKEFSVFRDHIFYQPTDTNKPAIYLTDLFTIFSDKNIVEPRLFSHSMLSILKLAQNGSAEQIATLQNNFKQSVQWPLDWETQLKPLYQKEFPTIINELETILSPYFNPQQFSILSYGTVGNVTERLLGIVKRNKRARNGKTGYDITIRKLYWL